MAATLRLLHSSLLKKEALSSHHLTEGMEEREELLHRRMKAGKSHGSQKISSPTFAMMMVGVEVTPLEKVKIKIILFCNVDFTRCRLSSEPHYCNSKLSEKKYHRITMGTGK